MKISFDLLLMNSKPIIDIRTVYNVFFVLIIVVAIFFRFNNFDNRWGLGYDQAHDVIVAKYALRENKVPLVGPFSSAGPFQTGGEWYWLIMLSTFFPIFGYLTPWVMTAMMGVIFVIAIMIFVTGFLGRGIGLIVGLLASISPSNIGQSINLTNQSPLPILSLFTLWSGLCFVKSKKMIYAFLLGFFASFAVTVHFQGVSLLVVVLLSHIYTKFSFKRIIISIFGSILPLVPLIYFDVLYQGINSKGLYYYLTIGQYVISYNALGRRWLSFIFDIVPKEWARITGGSVSIVTVFMVLVFITLIYRICIKSIDSKILFVFSSFVFMLIIIRYTRTPLFSSYFNFLHPYILILSAYSLYRVLLINRYLGFLFLLVFIFFTIRISFVEIGNGKNITHRQVLYWLNSIKTLLPNERYQVYDLAYQAKDKSLPFVFIADNEGLISDTGHSIGITLANSKKQVHAPILLSEMNGYQFFDLATFSAQMLRENEWVFINPSEIYRSTQDWPKHIP